MQLMNFHQVLIWVSPMPWHERPRAVALGDEDVEDALAYVNGTNGRSRPSMVKKPMSKETVAKVHVELLKTMEFKEAFKLYDSDNDGKADALQAMESRGCQIVGFWDCDLATPLAAVR